ncbi:MAG: HNH endonuclease [Eubacteriales bacterium]
MSIPLSKILKEYFNITTEQEEKDLQKDLNLRLSTICKPCWELKYCPYGYLVEGFPIRPLLKKEHKEHIEYLKKCLETGFMGENHDKPIDEERKKIFKQDINQEENCYCVENLSRFEKEASCNEFGHLCPAFFVSEPITETKEFRNNSRSIIHVSIIRVVRRDNNICQICGKTLLDSEIEIDHIIPYSRGGVSDENNLRVTCFD